MLQMIRSPKIYDVCIIGSGAAGGAAAKVLSEGGVSVVMLEAGAATRPGEGLQGASLALRSSPPRWGRGR
jgi:choline dehydrogenase-like flavoprotein